VVGNEKKAKPIHFAELDTDIQGSMQTAHYPVHHFSGDPNRFVSDDI
jgi:hypothetical protein